MALPLVPILGAGAAGALLYFLVLKKPAAGGSTACASLPPDIQPTYAKMMADPDVDPSALDQVAAQLNSLGFTACAQEVTARANSLRGGSTPAQPTTPKLDPVYPTPVAPAPAPAAPAAVATALPILSYVPNLAPVGHGSDGTYWPGDVRQDWVALRFLGYQVNGGPIPDPGGGVSQAADSAAGAGAWNPTFQAVVKAFQGDNGLTVDGWIGPQTRQKLGDLVGAKNAQNDAQNQANGVQGTVFSGMRKHIEERSFNDYRRRRYAIGASLSGAPSAPVARIMSPGGARLRVEPTPASALVDAVPAGERVLVLRGLGPFTQVQYRGQRGWVSTPCLAPAEGS